jgi:hypothetical protein
VTVAVVVVCWWVSVSCGRPHRRAARQAEQMACNPTPPAHLAPCCCTRARTSCSAARRMAPSGLPRLGSAHTGSTPRYCRHCRATKSPEHVHRRPLVASRGTTTCAQHSTAATEAVNRRGRVSDSRASATPAAQHKLAPHPAARCAVAVLWPWTLLVTWPAAAALLPADASMLSAAGITT